MPAYFRNCGNGQPILVWPVGRINPWCKLPQLWKFHPERKELLSVKLSKLSQSKGGKHPASEKQKSTSRMCILANQPWRASTGPRTSLGRCVSSQNSRTHGLYRVVQPLPRTELERLWRDPFYRQVERRMGQLQVQRDRESVAFKKWLRVVLMPEFLRRTNGH